METADKKMQKIADLLRKETLEPAKQEAREIVENANMQASSIVEEAKKRAQLLESEAKGEREKKKTSFESSLSIAGRQVIEQLKEKIEKELFTDSVQKVLSKTIKSPFVVAQFVEAVVEAIRKEGIETDITAYVAKDVDPKKVNEELIDEIKKRLKEKEVVIGDFEGGVKVKLHQKKITIDISAEALREMLTDLILGDFRELIFQK